MTLIIQPNNGNITSNLFLFYELHSSTQKYKKKKVATKTSNEQTQTSKHIHRKSNQPRRLHRNQSLRGGISHIPPRPAFLIFKPIKSRHTLITRIKVDRMVRGSADTLGVFETAIIICFRDNINAGASEVEGQGAVGGGGEGYGGRGRGVGEGYGEGEGS